ncbi:MAG: rRNA maturation RNase YbeY [Proteobacteria bacterium]|nr:rRNA maturation RNase YbeY [Pseudomonadota bacterium]
MRVTVTLSSSPPISRFYAHRIRQAIRLTLSHIPKTVTHPLRKQKGRLIISVALVGIPMMRKLNRTYRKKDKPTDVLSFSRLDDLLPNQPQIEIGDLIICLPVAKRQAREYQETLGRELERLTVHGTLHLFGYDHEKSKKEECIMFRLQDKILHKLSSKHLKT